MVYPRDSMGVHLRLETAVPSTITTSIPTRVPNALADFIAGLVDRSNPDYKDRATVIRTLLREGAERRGYIAPDA